MPFADLSTYVLDVDSLQRSYFTISGLGYGSFGFAILAKAKKNLKEILYSTSQKQGTMLDPVAKNSGSNLYSNGLVAIKVMKTQLAKPSDYLNVNEIRFILSVPSHENLLQIFNLFVDKYNGRLNIVMEPMDQNLFQFIQKNQDRPVADWIVKSILAQTLNAIRHIHSHGFFHRDVKPENILVSLASHYYGGRMNVPLEREKDLYIIKLCDYGLARHTSNTRELTPYVSTRWYRAPEILLRLQEYSFPIDIWAFGCVAVELANRYPLFCGKNESEQLWEILKVLGHPLNQTRDDIGGKWNDGVHLANELGFIMPFTLSSSINDILRQYEDLGETIKRCFMWDPSLRPSASQLSNSDYFKDSILHENTSSLPISANTVSLNRYSDDLQHFEYSPMRNLKTDDAGHSNHQDIDDHKIYNVYSDPIVSTHTEEFMCQGSGYAGDTLEVGAFEKFTTFSEENSALESTNTNSSHKEFFDTEAMFDENFRDKSFASPGISPFVS